MRLLTLLSLSFAGCVLCLSLSGCASSEQGAGKAQPGVGYVDLFADPPRDVCWDVSRFNAKTAEFERLHWKMKPPPNGVLRLKTAVGDQKLRVAFLDVAVEAPLEVTVPVAEGKVTPVRIKLAEVSNVAVQTREAGWGASVKGPAGRRYRTGSGETVMFRISSTVEPTTNLGDRGEMPYAR